MMPLEILAWMLVIGIAMQRVLMFAITDEIFDPLRNAIYAFLLRKHRGWRKWLFKLINCPICLSVWVCAIATDITWAMPNTDLPALGWLWVWLGSCVVALKAWQLIDPKDERTYKVELTQEDDG